MIMYNVRFIFFLCLLWLATSLVSAQTVDQPKALRASYSHMGYSGELNESIRFIDHGFYGGSLQLSQYLNPSFYSVFGADYQRLRYANIDTASTIAGHLLHFSAGINYNFRNGYILSDSTDVKFNPYLGASFGYWGGKTSGTIDDKPFSHTIDEVNLGLTAGCSYDLTQKMSVFVEYNQYLSTAEEWDAASSSTSNDNYFTMKVGLIFKIGKFHDDDKDGVANSKDQCPDTPHGVPVDENGCPLDIDDDGIYDYLDDCPDIPGLPEFNGCPDTDGDGFPDHEDDCPEVPGVPEFNGCPDTDGDGVPDKDDICPDTPPGIAVDRDGCPVDSDGDGVFDDVDLCPDEPGPIDYLGCPQPEEFNFVDPSDQFPEVYFETEQSELSIETRTKLNELVKYMFMNPQYNIRIFGHADPSGSESFNLKLSKNRVDSVYNYLIRKGVPPHRIMRKGYGETRQKGLEKKEYKKSRKVEFIFYESFGGF